MNTKDVKRKILRDRTFPGSEQINRRQDFDRIRQDYSMVKQVMMKKAAIWGGGALVTAVVAGTVYLNQQSTEQPPRKADFVKLEQHDQPFVREPLPGKQTPYSVFRVSAKKGGTISYETGSHITIPENAFENVNGNPVGDTVEVKYREFHNPLDIFLSGIPMEYDSGGIKYLLESAGMLEIQAFDNGEKLALKNGSPIKIEMASATEDSRFCLYELDTVRKNWVYRGKEKVTLPGRKEMVPHHETRFAKGSDNPTILRPALSDDKKYSFSISYDKHAFPELAAYENVMFEVTDDGFKPAYFRINWDRISLLQGDEPGIYSVWLKKADTAIVVNARPVFDKENYAKAMEKFEERRRQSETEATRMESVRRTKLKEVNAGLSAYDRNQMVAAAVNMAAAGNVFAARAFRSFTIKGLGFHNCDFPIPPVIQFAYSLRKNGNNADGLSYSTIYVVEKGKNTVSRFSRNEPVRCNPRGKNLIWTVTDDKKEFAFFQPVDFTRLSRGEQNVISPVVERNEGLALNRIKQFLE